MPDAKRILVIDDEEVLRTMLREVLEMSGYAVETAPGGEEGLRAHEQKPFDLVITDNNMPGVGGLDVIERMAGSRAPAPVILMTGYGSIDVSMRAHELGAAGYLLKPFDDIGSIPKEVARVFSRMERERELHQKLRGGK